MKPFSSRRLFLFLSSLLLCGVSHLSGIVTLAIDGESSPGPLSGQSSDPNVTAVQLNRGPDLNADTAFPGFYDSSNWDTGNVFPGTGSGSYVSFSFEVAPGYTLDPTSFLFYYEDDGLENSPLRIDLRTSRDAFASALFLDTNPRDGLVKSVGDLALDPVSGSVEYRFFGYAASGPSGILGFTDNVGILFEGSPVAVLMEGDLAVVPEPAHAGLVIGLLAALGLAFRRQRRG